MHALQYHSCQQIIWATLARFKPLMADCSLYSFNDLLFYYITVVTSVCTTGQKADKTNHCAVAAKSKYDQSLARSFDRRLIGSNLKQKRSPPPFLFSLRTLLWTTPSESPLMKNNPAMETCRQFHVVSPPQWYLITLPYAFAHCKILFQLGSFHYENKFTKLV